MYAEGFTADLIGGPCSGQRVRMAGYFLDRPGARWRQALPPLPESIAGYWLQSDADLLSARPVLRFAEYRRIGVRPDGRRVFAFYAPGSAL